ncbi:MAG TPA: DUF2341 domain-containing protein, partial [Methanomicrobiales archaeon]|nr:DUF2341 domain-containing protein [Methanomicrobiales archaeon]
TGAQSDGDDIVFTDSGGTTVLPHEIESFTKSSGALVAWVKLPTVSSSANTDIYLYYGNSSTASQQNASGVWDSNYRGVWHMNVTADSTSLNTCTNQGSTSTTGKVNNARYFGTSQYIDCGAFENLNNQLTLETWLKLDTNIPASTWPNDVGKGNENWGGWRLYSQNSNQLMFAYNGSDNSIHYDLYDNINLGTWYQVAITFDVSGNSARMYVNGQPYMTAGASHGISNGPQNLIIGTTSNQLNTNLDEVRISNVARSPGWIATEYANQNRPDLFFSVGTEEASPCGGSGGSGCTGIAVDSTASGASGNSTSTLSISHTTSGSNRLMLVGVSLQDSDTSWNDYTNKVNVSSISYNGKSLSRVGYALNADDARVEIWRLIAPDTGTYNVIITLNQSLHNNGYIVGGVMTFTGVDQTTPLGTFASQALNESVIPVNVTVSSAANELVFGAIANEYGSISSDTTGGQIGRWSRHVGIGMDAGDGNGLEYTNGAGSTKPGAASVKMNWTLGNWYNHWAAAGVSIKPCSSGCTLGTVGVDVISSGQNTTPISGITLSHATSGSNRLMLVGVTINNDNFEGVSTIAYNGTALTYVGYSNNLMSGNDDAYTEIWKLVAPDPGTHNVVITFNKTLSRYASAGAMTFTGANQTIPLSTFAGNQGDDDNLINVTVPSAAGDLVFGVIADEYNSVITNTDGGEIERWNYHLDSTDWTNGAGATKPGATPSVMLKWNLSSTVNHWATAGVSIKPACV